MKTYRINHKRGQTILAMAVLSPLLGLAMALFIRYVAPMDSSFGASLVEGIQFSTIFFAMTLVFFLASIPMSIWVTSRRARLEIDDSILREYDRMGRLITEGDLRHVMTIEEVKMKKSKAFVIRFPSGQFAVYGTGFAEFDELHSRILSITHVQPCPATITLIELGRSMSARRPL